MINFTQAPKSLCLFRLSAIGDVTHILPVIHTLKKVWPETEITWVIGKLEYQLVKSLPGVEFVIFDKSDGWNAYGKLRRQLRGRQFDILLMMQAALRASIASLFISAKIKLGFDRQRAVDFQWLFSNHKISGDNRVHVLDGFFQFLEALGINKKILDWDLPLSDSDLEYARTISNGEKYVVINPCSSARKNNWRNWPEESYAKIIKNLNSKKLKVVLTGGPSSLELDFGKTISSQCDSALTNLIGETSLGELLALLKDAEFIIAPDTGPAHMATAVDTPVIGLYASSNPERTGPYKSRAYLVDHYEDALKQYNHKTVAQANWGERVRDPAVMSLIRIEDVIERVDKLISAR